MDLTASEIKEVNSVLRTYIAHAKHKNKKDRLKSALNKLENIEAKKEIELFKKLLPTNNYVTFAKRNICPRCLQKVVPSTMEVS
tara:strand:- start:185 stop:436 length:252 start_codon:yes stop_codon:yes gene_type:complete